MARGRKKGRSRETRSVEDSTYLSNKTHVDLHIAPKLGEFKAAKLGKRAIEQAAAGWKEQTSAKNANKILRSLNAAFKFALQNPDEFGVAQNPMVQVKQLPEVRSAKEIAGGMVDHGTDAPEKKDGLLRPIQPNEVYSALELRAIIENANGGMEKPLFMTAMLCGVRHGELNSPRWAMIDLKHGILTVNRSLTQLGKKHGGPRLEEPKTKNAKRQLELVPALVKELREWKIACPPNANDLVFVDAMGRPTNRKANNDALKVCCERAQVKALSMNNLRHSFASQQLIGGTTPLEVSYMMGHSSPAVTQALYCHWAKTEKSDAQVNLANRILTATDENEKKSEGLNPYN